MDRVSPAGGGVRLEWTNKELLLQARGESEYSWAARDEPDPRPTAVSVLDVGVQSDQSWDNLVVCGDALDALNASGGAHQILQPGSVRLLYIDPPFNTGKGWFGDYDDALHSSMWLSMIRDRLGAIVPYLAPDASVWLHLDDSEIHRARCVLDEVFGADAFVATIIWQKRTTRESRSAFSTNHDNILVYAPCGPRAWKKRRNLLLKSAANLQNRDSDPRGPWADAPFTAPGYRANQQYDIVNPAGRTLRPPRGRSWYATEATYRQLLADDRIWFSSGGRGNPRLKLFAHQIRGLVPFSVWGSTETGTNDDAKRHLQKLFPSAPDVFSTPKPEDLLERIIHIATDPGELVVDLFAGSGSTVSTAHKMSRRWLAVERSVATVSDVLHPRLLKVITGEDPGGITGQYGWEGGGSYRVIQVKPTRGRVRTLRLVEPLGTRGRPGTSAQQEVS
jgi:adenine-specific DNA-methyltransferase